MGPVTLVIACHVGTLFVLAEEIWWEHKKTKILVRVGRANRGNGRAVLVEQRKWIKNELEAENLVGCCESDENPFSGGNSYLNFLDWQGLMRTSARLIHPWLWQL